MYRVRTQCQISQVKSFKSIHKQQLKTKNHSEAYRETVYSPEIRYQPSQLWWMEDD
jgi:hypothetical protein